MTVFFSQLINGLSLGSIYALIALGYSCLLYTSCSQIVDKLRLTRYYKGKSNTRQGGATTVSYTHLGGHRGLLAGAEPPVWHEWCVGSVPGIGTAHRSADPVFAAAR